MATGEPGFWNHSVFLEIASFACTRLARLSVLMVRVSQEAGQPRQQLRRQSVRCKGLGVDALSDESVCERGEALEGAVGDVGVVGPQEGGEGLHAHWETLVVRFHLGAQSERFKIR